MTTPSIPLRLCELIRDAFDPKELIRFTHWQLQEYLHNIANVNDTYDSQVHDLITWAQRQGRFDDLIRKAAKVRPHRQDLQDLLKEWEALTLPSGVAGRGHVLPSQVPTVPVPAGTPHAVSSLVSDLHQMRFTLSLDNRAKKESDLISRLAQEVSEMNEPVPDAWCTDPHAEYRLAAVIRLEQRPDPRYASWLAERVGVDIPMVGRRAATALACGAAKSGDTSKSEYAGALAVALAALRAARDDDDRWAILTSAASALDRKLSREVRTESESGR